MYPHPMLCLIVPTAWRDALNSAPTLGLHLLIIFGGAELETEQRVILNENTSSTETSRRPVYWMTPMVWGWGAKMIHASHRTLRCSSMWAWPSLRCCLSCWPRLSGQFKNKVPQGRNGSVSSCPAVPVCRTHPPGAGWLQPLLSRPLRALWSPAQLLLSRWSHQPGSV